MLSVDSVLDNVCGLVKVETYAGLQLCVAPPSEMGSPVALLSKFGFQGSYCRCHPPGEVLV